jgi:hypothetical protein
MLFKAFLTERLIDLEKKDETALSRANVTYVANR